MDTIIRSRSKFFAHYYLFSFVLGVIFYVIMFPMVSVLTNSNSTALQVRIALGLLCIPLLVYSFLPYIDGVVFQELVVRDGIICYTFGAIRNESVKVKISDLICIKTTVTPWMRIIGCKDVCFLSKGVDLFCFKGMSNSDVNLISELMEERGSL